MWRWRRLSVTGRAAGGWVAILGVACEAVACEDGKGGERTLERRGGVAEQAQAPDPFRDAALEYVKLVLAVGQHDPDYVDAYYGPPELRTRAEAVKRPLADIDADAARLASRIAETPLPGWKDDEELWVLRKEYLGRQVAALRARVAMLQGARFSFDEESKALYDAVAPRHTEEEFADILAALE